LGPMSCSKCDAAIKVYIAKANVENGDLHTQEHLKALRDAVWVCKQEKCSRRR